MTIFFTSHNPATTFMAILLAVLVAQSRVEAGVHSLREVVLGAVLAIFLTSLVYWVMPKMRKLMAKPVQNHATLPAVPAQNRRVGQVGP
jgi:membrane-associated phospholipid phosphatase